MPSGYDLNSHAVFEASAGTGKTYNVEQLVLRFLTEKRVPLDKILLVTFTEKAAAELRERLRRKIESELQHGGEPALRAALDNYDSAQIYTIHAFCLRVLQQFPMAHGQNARAQMTRDAEVMQACLREVQRTCWPREYQAQLPNALAVSAYADPNSGGASWEERVTRVAGSFRPGCGHRLKPEATINAGELAELERTFGAGLQQLAQLIGPCPGPDIRMHPLYAAYEKVGIRASWLEGKREQVLWPLLLWATDPEAVKMPLVTFAALLRQCKEYKPFGKDGFTTLVKDAKQPDACGELQQIIIILEGLRHALSQVEFALAAGTVRRVLEEMDTYKVERGLQSFEDFLTRVAKALDPAQNPRAEELLSALRDAYHVAIVDEFQDTDPIQWAIFRRVFVEAPGSDHQLILVGDPKQAIYSFRNADVAAYLAARDEITRQGHAPFALSVSYRSSKPLLEALNALFGKGELFPRGDKIEYHEVSPAEPDKRPEVVSDRTGRRAMTAVQFPDAITTGKAARRRMAEFTAEEIGRLLRGAGGEPLLTFSHRGQTRPLRADHIAVLVYKRAEARWVEEELRRRGIPYSFYKKSGIWQSDEAVHLGLVLKALARADDRAHFRAMLLTRFFGIPPEDVAARAESSQGDALQWLFMRWRELAERRRWAELFRSILEDTGTLWQEAQEADGARRLANYRYISQELASAAYQEGGTLLDMVDLLQHKRRTGSDDESGLQPLETERPTVKLMTVHACKGLEFPVVFLAGGFTSRGGSSYLKYHDDEDGRLVFNLDTDDAAAKPLAKKEEEDEARRLLYVALTRAMLKLYVPCITQTIRFPGPVATILSPAITQAELIGSDVCGAVTTSAPKCGAALLTETEKVEAGDAGSIAPPSPLMPDVDLGRLAQRRTEVQSFSRIVQHAPHTPHAPLEHELQLPDRPPREDDDQPDAVAADPLPPGAAAGDVLHAVLEGIEFSAVKQAPDAEALLADGSVARLLIEDSLRRHMPQTADDARELARRARRVAELVWTTLRTPLPDVDGTALCALAADKRLHEVEFHMPFDIGGRGAPTEEIARDAGGFLTGWMDLVFLHDERFYLLDWKSNSLASYAREALAQDITARCYDLQYGIYLQALQRWFTRVRPGFRAASDFGGVFYMYLRGMNGSDGSRGVFFHRPTADEWDERKLAARLRRQLGTPRARA